MTQQANGFEIDSSAVDKLNGAMNMGGGIELPFEAPTFWWLNGNNANKALAGPTPAVYYGGWAVNEDNLLEVVAERGGLPDGLVQTEIFSREGKSIPSYTTRLLVVAPIAFRQCWVSGGQQAQVRTADYAIGARQHIQVLSLMGAKLENGSYTPWGAVVLSAKGYQAQYLQSAMKDWKKALERPRREHAGAVPPWAFWCALGTYGKEVQNKMVGKTGSQSPVTPVNLYVPKEITVETLRKLYVGKDGVNDMARLLGEAEDWLAAWKKPDAPRAGNGAADDYEDDYTPPEPHDEIPF